MREGVTEKQVRPSRAMSARQGTQCVLIDSLRAGDSPRLNGEDAQHIEMLAASEQELPPILVNRRTMQVIDGMHRLRAALLRGQQSIKVEYFEGSGEEAFVVAVEANIAHGLPLSLADRQAAAARIITSHPNNSDRSIAAMTGLAAGTVATIRRRLPAVGSQLMTRIGRDGRVRPMSTSDGRRIARDELARNPGASLREIAKTAGISPATVRDVRDRIRRGDDPVPYRQAGGRKRGDRAASNRSRVYPHGRATRDCASLLQDLRKDPSLKYTEPGRALLRWLDTRASGPGESQDFLEATPPHCAYLVVELARRCAADWQEFADQLEQRIQENLAGVARVDAYYLTGYRARRGGQEIADHAGHIRSLGLPPEDVAAHDPFLDGGGRAGRHLGLDISGRHAVYVYTPGTDLGRQHP